MKRTLTNQLCALAALSVHAPLQLVCMCASKLVPAFHRTFVSGMTWAQVWKTAQ